jgi:diguanylate cyclase (GGDEF)-like protein
VAERIRAGVAARQQLHAATELGIVTISVGVAAAIPIRVPNYSQLIKLADNALYEAKRSGRNQVRTSH